MDKRLISIAVNVKDDWRIWLETEGGAPHEYHYQHQIIVNDVYDACRIM